jgi:enoyl-CoA hydratase/carnithine racemase
MPNHVTCTVEDQVAHVALDRPDKLNGLTLDMLGDLAATARRLRGDRTLRAVVLSGNGPSFSAGLDFASVLAKPHRIATAFAHRPWRGTNTFQEACWAWRRLPVPVVAAVRGHCFGGGLQLALAADFRLSTPDAQWSVLEVKWGLIPDMSGIRTLAELLGIDVAKRLTMTGDVVSGTEAQALGLVTEVHDDPYAGALALVERLRQRSPDSLAAAKRLFNGRWNSGPRATFARERSEQLRLLVNQNTTAARRAAMEKQPPVFAPRKRR